VYLAFHDNQTWLAKFVALVALVALASLVAVVAFVSLVSLVSDVIGKFDDNLFKCDRKEFPFACHPERRAKDLTRWATRFFALAQNDKGERRMTRRGRFVSTH